VLHLHIKQHDLFQKEFITIDKIPKNRNLLCFVGIFCNRLLNGGGSYVAPWIQPP
jgi:hypothetical protein